MAAHGVRTRNLFDSSDAEPYRLSRSKLELFLQCPRCFYLDRRLGIGQPSGPPFTLNNAVDHLLKKEFDACRVRQEAHAIMDEYGIDAIPLLHPQIDEWRDMRIGVQCVHPQSNFLFFGAIDDAWVDRDGSLIVVDYKATSSEREVTIDDEWKRSYKRQMEMYQWLLRRNGYPVSDTGYFVYLNADRSRSDLSGALHFVTKILPYRGDDGWVDDALMEARACLSRDALPGSSSTCEWCAYRKAARDVEQPLVPLARGK